MKKSSIKKRFSLDLFCNVVDNWGDAGVCWRLAKQLALEYPVEVRLWIDHLNTLGKFCPDLDTEKSEQRILDVVIKKWNKDSFSPDFKDIPDIVIEGFGCALPEDYVNAMAKKTPHPIWINMEYLSAELWVDDFHRMPSPQSIYALTKYFFFPGFTKKTGGLIRESNLLNRAIAFQNNKTDQTDFLERIGVKSRAKYLLSLFCYDTAPVSVLFDILAKQQDKSILCLIPKGVADSAVSSFLGEGAKIGAKKTKGNLTVEVIPILSQEDYDRLLWMCDLNFVRGEDSFVRAQWALKPFIWQIYPQAENAHIPKLQAFLSRYLEDLKEDDAAKQVAVSWNTWNRIEENSGFKDALMNMISSNNPNLEKHAVLWAKKLAAQPDFALSLFRFIKSMR